MFGDADTSPQSELTTFNPRSVYGISKLAAFHLVRNYRHNHKLFVAAGILYNHESPRRGFQFVTRKISTAVAKISLGLADRLEMGNIDAQRDWGYAPDYVVAMHAMLQLEKPDDFVVATGVLHTVRDLLVEAFSVAGLHYEPYVEINRNYFRPGETVPLCGDAGKARRILNWQPTKSFEQIVTEMVQADIGRIKNNQ
jgi:GDPmannose 4,6-dehydratase